MFYIYIILNIFITYTMKININIKLYSKIQKYYIHSNQ